MKGKAARWVAIGAVVMTVVSLATSCSQGTSAAQDAKRACQDAESWQAELNHRPSITAPPTTYVYNPYLPVPTNPTTTLDPTISAEGVQAMSLAASSAKGDQRWVPLATAMINFIQSVDSGQQGSSQDAKALDAQCAIAQAR